MDNQGYKSLIFFKQTKIIYDFKVEFCKLYKFSILNKGSDEAVGSFS